MKYVHEGKHVIIVWLSRECEKCIKCDKCTRETEEIAWKTELSRSAQDYANTILFPKNNNKQQ